MTTPTTGAAELPEALRLAACFDDNTSVVGAKRIAAELRRLHAENEALRAQPAGAATPAKPSPHADADEIALFDEYMRGCREYNIEPDLGTAFHAGRKSARGAATPAAITVEQVEDYIGLQSTAWDNIGAEKIVEAVLRLANATPAAPAPGVPSGVVTTEAAMRAIHQAIDLIGDPTDERMRTVRRVLRGAVVVAEDEAAAQEPVAIVKWRIGGKVVHLVGDVEIGALLYTHPQPAVTAGAVDALDAARYRVVRRGQHWSVIDGIGDPLMGDALDMAIDAALAAQREVKP